MSAAIDVFSEWEGTGSTDLRPPSTLAADTHLAEGLLFDLAVNLRRITVEKRACALHLRALTLKAVVMRWSESRPVGVRPVGHERVVEAMRLAQPPWLRNALVVPGASAGSGRTRDCLSIDAMLDEASRGKVRMQTRQVLESDVSTSALRRCGPATTRRGRPRGIASPRETRPTVAAALLGPATRPPEIVRVD
jgi:hypothetical protein